MLMWGISGFYLGVPEPFSNFVDAISDPEAYLGERPGDIVLMLADAPPLRPLAKHARAQGGLGHRRPGAGADVRDRRHHVVEPRAAEAAEREATRKPSDARLGCAAGSTGASHLRCVDRPDPKPGPGQVLIRVQRSVAELPRSGWWPQVPISAVRMNATSSRCLTARATSSSVGAGVTRFRIGDRVAGMFFQRP